MKRRRIVILVFALMGLCINLTLSQNVYNINPGFDFSGIEEFWKIVDILKTDKDPSEEQWQALFGTPGYAELIQREFEPDYFKNAMCAVYMPSKKSLAEEMIGKAKQKGGFFAWYTPLVIEGFRNADKDRDWIQARVEELKSYPYLKKAAEEALKFLPEEKAVDYPSVAFIIFNDSRGYTPLIIGLSEKEVLSTSELECLHCQGRDKHWPFVLHLAHEAFHLYRDKHQEFNFLEDNSPDYPIIWILDQIENEGIGDLINREQLYYDNGCFVKTDRAKRYHLEQDMQPSIIRIMDAFLKEMAATPSLIGHLGKQMRSLIPQSGHPTGFFMTRAIVRQFGEEALVNIVRNPFKFFYLYNDAAKKDSQAPILSDQAVDFIKVLESRYGTNEKS
ncbi:DUF5700 domain-containing putative Zn-dependent protease [Acidobacteriota bacterium]